MKLSPSQSGRSMVEILGVLAIVGVLSIGSIMGYSYAMDKYRANTTVNDIMLRATDLLAQANQGHTELSLTEWEEEDTIYPISNADYANDGTVMLDAGLESNPIPKRVCEMIFNDIFPHTVQIDTNAVRGISGEACDENNIMTFYFDPTGAGPAVCEPACEEGAVCDNGACFKTNQVAGWPVDIGLTCSTNEDCQAGYTGNNCAKCTNGKCIRNMTYERTDCTLADGTPGMCTYGQCKPKGCTYDNNVCTGEYEYCVSPNTSGCEAFPENSTGTCAAASVRRYEVDGRVYFASNSVESWWEAKAICDALGLNFVPLAELYRKNEEGVWVRTDLMKKLRQIGGNGFMSIYGEEKSSCTGLVMGSAHDELTVWTKNAAYNGHGTALCR